VPELSQVSGAVRVTTMRKNVSPELGSFLVEAMMTLTLLTVGILGVVSSLRSNYRASQDIGNQDQAFFALETVIATLRSTPFPFVCSTYQNQTLPVPSYYGKTPQTLNVQVHFDTNETALPAAYGPVTDLDGDAVLMTTNVTSSY